MTDHDGSTHAPSAEELTRFVHRSMPLCAQLGIRCTASTAAEVVLELDWAAELCTIGGALHGGALIALADSGGALCAFGNLPQGAIGTTTIESKTNFLAGVTSGTVVARSTPLHAGSTTIVVETEVRRGDGRLVIKTTQTQAVLRPR